MAAIGGNYQGLVYDLYSRVEGALAAVTSDEKPVTIQNGVLRAPGHYTVGFNNDGQIVINDVTEARKNLTDSERVRIDEANWSHITSVVADRISNLSYDDVTRFGLSTMKARGFATLGTQSWSRPNLERLVQVISIVARESMIRAVEGKDMQVGGFQINSGRGKLSDVEKSASDRRDWDTLNHKLLCRLPNLTPADLNYHPVLRNIRTVKEDGTTRPDGVRPSEERVKRYVEAAFQMAFSLPKASLLSSPMSAA